MRALILGCLIAGSTLGCTSSSSGSGTGGGAGGGGDGAVELTVFARDLILNQTASNNAPTPTEDKNLVDVAPTDFADAGFFP